MTQPSPSCYRSTLALFHPEAQSECMGFPETFPVYIVILQDHSKRASAALCLPAFCHLGLKSDVSYWACSQAHLTSRSNLHESSLGICDASLSATIRIQVLLVVQGRHTHETALPHRRCNSFPDRWNRVCAIMPRRSLPRMGTTPHLQSREHLPDTQERLVHAHGL